MFSVLTFFFADLFTVWMEVFIKIGWSKAYLSLWSNLSTDSQTLFFVSPYALVI